MSRVYQQTPYGVQLLESAHTPDYEGLTGVVINPAAVPACELRFMKIVDGALMEMTQEEKGVVLIPEQNAQVKMQISECETGQLRCTREYLLGDAAALGRLRDIEDQITALRAQLK